MIAQIKNNSKNIAILLVFVFVMGLSGCIVRLVNKEDVIGTYLFHENGTANLLDGRTEILKLESDGTCSRVIQFKDSRTLTTQGAWEWCSGICYLPNKVKVTGIYWTMDGYERVNPDLEKSLDYVQSLRVGRTLTGRIVLGLDEGSHYEKK